MAARDTTSTLEGDTLAGSSAASVSSYASLSPPTNRLPVVQESRTLRKDAAALLTGIASPFLPSLDSIIDSGYLPHFVIRRGIRYQLRERAEMIASTSVASAYESKMLYVKSLRSRPMAIETDKANEQHYEVGTAILGACLGPRMKYSSCLYPKGNETLAQAEVEMLKLYIERAGLRDGQKILDLGCGWGSFSIFAAEQFPNSDIVAFSNSSTQKEHIDEQASVRGLKNLRCFTGDVVDYNFRHNHYDRVVSIELFEHMKNYELLMSKVAHALKPGGKLFVHIFSHRSTPYDFESGWMTDHFFTGGTMPSADLLHYFQRDLTLEEQWWVNGKHYAKTCEDWLAKLVRNRRQVWPALEETYGQGKAGMWYARWQVFYLACAELFAWEGGDTWGVSHYTFRKPRRREV